MNVLGLSWTWRCRCGGLCVFDLVRWSGLHGIWRSSSAVVSACSPGRAHCSRANVDGAPCSCLFLAASRCSPVLCSPLQSWVRSLLCCPEIRADPRIGSARWTCGAAYEIPSGAPRFAGPHDCAHLSCSPTQTACDRRALSLHSPTPLPFPFALNFGFDGAESRIVAPSNSATIHEQRHRPIIRKPNHRSFNASYASSLARIAPRPAARPDPGGSSSRTRGTPS